MSNSRRSKSPRPKAPPKRGPTSHQDWRAGRPRGELVRAWVAGAVVVAVSVAGVVILGRGFIWTDDPTPIPIPSPTASTIPIGDDVTPPPSATEIPTDSAVPPSTAPGAPAP